MISNNPKFLIYTLAFQAIVCALIVFRVPYLQQVLGFIFFAFVPGYLLLRAFRVEKSHLAEIIVFSVGLSIAFLMLIGLLVNELGLLGILANPLATEPLFIALNTAVALLCITSYFTNKSYKGLNSENWGKFWQYLPFLVLPLLSIISVMLILYFNSNLLAILVIVLIAIVFVASALRSKLSQYYPLILLSIVLALLLSSALMSNYVYGDDIQGELNRFTSTRTDMIWNPQNYLTNQQMSDNSMLSITIFPTILSNLLNIEPAFVYKIVFLVIFSLVPIGLYELYRKHWNERIAFVSVLFLISNYVYFIVLLQEAKQMIAELFYVLLFLELLNSDAKSNKSNWMIIVLSLFGLVVSHYSMAFIFLLLILFTWLGGKLFFRKSIRKINASIVAFTASLLFFWYLYVIPAGPFYKFVGIFKNIFGSFVTEFYSSSSRGTDVQAALGLVSRPSQLHYVGTYLYDFSILLILIGFVVFIIAWRKKKVISEFGLLVSLNIVLLISAVAVPQFSGLLELGRLYQIILMFLSPLFVIGAEAIFKSLLKIFGKKNPLNPNVKKQRTTIALVLTLIILVAFFLFGTGFIYEVSNDPVPSSFSLSYYKLQSSPILVHEVDVFSAQWISNYGDIIFIPTFADTVAYTHVITSYSTIKDYNIFLLSNDNKVYQNPGLFPYFRLLSNNSYVYLSQFDVEHQAIEWDVRNNVTFPFTELPMLNSTNGFVNRIYSNGASEIEFRTPPNP